MCDGDLSHSEDLLSNEKKLLDLLTILEEEQRHVVMVSPFFRFFINKNIIEKHRGA
jgi:hypothetical protein